MNTCLEGEPEKVAVNKQFLNISTMKSIRKPRTKQGVNHHQFDKTASLRLLLTFATVALEQFTVSITSV